MGGEQARAAFEPPQAQDGDIFTVMGPRERETPPPGKRWLEKEGPVVPVDDFAAGWAMVEARAGEGYWARADFSPEQPTPAQAVVFQYMKPDGTYAGWALHWMRR